jgi:hypothetical protein
VAGGMAKLGEALRRYRAKKVVLCTGKLEPPMVAALVEACRAAEVELLEMRLEFRPMEEDAETNAARPPLRTAEGTSLRALSASNQ